MLRSNKPVFPNKSERELRLFHDFREQREAREQARRSTKCRRKCVWRRRCRILWRSLGIFRERLAIACRLRGITYDQLCSSIGLGGRRTVDLEHAGLRALDIYRLAQIADRLDVSIDWLLGRSKAMELREKQCQGEIG